MKPNGSMKGHVKNKIHPRQLSEDVFLDSLPLLRRELLPISLPAIYPGSQYDSLSAPRARVVPFDVQVKFSGFDFRSFSARSPAETASLRQAAALALWVGFGCQPWFYWRLRGLQLSPVMRGGIQLGQVLSPKGHLGHQAL